MMFTSPRYITSGVQAKIPPPFQHIKHIQETKPYRKEYNIIPPIATSGSIMQKSFQPCQMYPSNLPSSGKLLQQGVNRYHVQGRYQPF